MEDGAYFIGYAGWATGVFTEFDCRIFQNGSQVPQLTGFITTGSLGMMSISRFGVVPAVVAGDEIKLACSALPQTVTFYRPTMTLLLLNEGSVVTVS